MPNRQERRRLAKLAATEAANMKYLEERQIAVNDRLLGLYAVAIGLAYHELFGRSKDDNIVALIQEWNRQICRIARDDVTYEQLVKELLDKTGISFEMR